MSWRSKPSRVPGPDIPLIANALVDTGANQGCAWQPTGKSRAPASSHPTELDRLRVRHSDALEGQPILGKVLPAGNRESPRKDRDPRVARGLLTPIRK